MAASPNSLQVSYFDFLAFIFVFMTLSLPSGLYEYKISNTFGATAFCSYGAFWCSYAGYVWFIVPTLPAGTCPHLTIDQLMLSCVCATDKVHESSGLFLLMWLIFTLYMTVASLRVSFLFSVLSVTFTLLVIGDFA
jgi:succinate-acetate transporter protein